MDTTPNPPVPASLARLIAPAVAVVPGTLYRRSPIRALRTQLEEQIGRSAETVDAAMQVLVAECDLRAYEARNSSEWWGRTYYLLGAPAALLATVAAATAQADVPPFVITVLALLSAGLTTLVTYLNMNANRDRNLALSAAWSELADDVRVNLLNYATERCVAGAVAAPAVHHKYSQFIVQVHKRKAKLLRGEVPSAQSPGAS